MINKLQQSDNSISEARMKFIKSSLNNLKLGAINEELNNAILPKLLNGNDNEKKEAEAWLDKRMSEILRSNESDTHIALMESFDPKFQALATELASNIIKEQNCVTALEKSIVTVIVGAKIRILDNTTRLNKHLNDLYNINKEDTRYLDTLSKQIERSTRQFLSAVIVLKQLKSPQVEMNIKTNTAFISQNQQINVDNKINESK